MEWGYWSELVQGGGSGGRAYERREGMEDLSLDSLSLMERSRRVGVVSLPGIGGGKRRLPSPLSPDSALGSDEEARKAARTEDDEEDEGDENPPRHFRTPSVVISDYSDDPILDSSTVSLDDIERLRAEYDSRSGQDSGSECSATSSWSSWGLEPSDYSLRTPQRKASDCSTCSTLSGDEDNLQPVILQQLVNKKVRLVHK